MAPVLWTNHSAKLDKTREMTFDTLLKIGSSRNYDNFSGGFSWFSTGLARVAPQQVLE